MLRKTISVVLGLTLLFLQVIVNSPVHAQGIFKLTVIHTNDTRATHLPDKDGIGGDAREATLVKQIRADSPNSLLLDDGGRFTGTLFHRFFVGEDNVQIMNAIGYQAMALGNTEFDNGDEKLAQFITDLAIPVVSANIDARKSDLLAGKIKPSTVIEVGGQKIGIIGLITADTPRLSSPEKSLVFNQNYTAVVQKEVAALNKQGVNKIILLSQLGYDQDQKLAPQLSGVALIVGGRTRTVLSNTSKETQGPYPTVVKGSTGDQVLIVQAGGSLRYVGRIDIEFDSKGVPTKWNGDSVLLDTSIQEDKDIKGLINDLNDQVTKESARVLKTPDGTDVTVTTAINDLKNCRGQECAIGNLVADAMRAKTGAQIAIMNVGGMRGDGLAAGSVQVGEIYQLLPYSNRLSTFKLSGADIATALANGVSTVGAASGTGRFPHVSGLRYTYDASKPPTNRIVNIEVLDQDGTTYKPLDPNVIYTVASNDFMRKGGDGYQVFSDKGIDALDLDLFLDDMLVEYVKANSPLAPKLEKRITANNLTTK